MTKVKICGLQTLEDVDAVNKVSPDYAGFVFAPSKRKVTDDEAIVMRRKLAKEILSVGVFVNDSIPHITKLCYGHVIDLIQLHGEESEEYVRILRSNTNIPIIKAVRLSSLESGVRALQSEAEYILYDAFVEDGIYGGSGKELDTSFLPTLVRPTFLAGGLNSENVEKVIRIHQPFCVDVSSGVEVEGKKSFLKMKQFVEKVRTIGGSER